MLSFPNGVRSRFVIKEKVLASYPSIKKKYIVYASFDVAHQRAFVTDTCGTRCKMPSVNGQASFLIYAVVRSMLVIKPLKNKLICIKNSTPYGVEKPKKWVIKKVNF